MERPTTVRISLARKLARDVLGANSVVFPPVDAQALVQARARVIPFDEDAEDGMTVYDRRRGRYCVYINRRRLRGRRVNFTWAHEAGHICLRHPEVYDCNRLTEHGRWILEREVSIFASELLMPRQWLDKFVPVACGPVALEQASRLFAVSQEALINRLAELGIQDHAETEAILREEAARKEVLYSHPARVLEWALGARVSRGQR